MEQINLEAALRSRQADHAQLAAEAVTDSELLDEVFLGLNAKPAAVKYGCLKIIRIISENNPEIIDDRFEFLSGLLSHDNNFFKWGSVLIVANLAAAAKDRKFEKIFDRYFQPVAGPVMITAANTIQGAGIIAAAKPELSNRIAAEILKTEDASYETDECHNIVLGHAIQSFSLFFDTIADKAPVIEFVRRRLDNSRNATRKKAEAFIKKYKIA